MEECRVMRMHECQQCGKRFKARGGLQQHLRIHSNDRPYQCHYCPKRFTQKSHVDQHERIHTGAKPFSCQFCGRSFRQRSQQMGHEATHANGVLSIAATIANQQQQQLTHLSNQSPINTNSEHHSPRTPDGSSPVSQQQRVQQQQQQQQHQSQTSQQQQNLSTQPSSTSNNPNVTDSNDLLGSPNGVGLMSQSAVTSLLALSQGANSAAVAQASMNSLQMPPGMQPQTLASVLAARSCGV
ncbi:unnamed protein product [Anisakis simplex]|uniref:Zinc finger protein n=1 Tax=Anisakis simplex TaxID=6269 RepID=A0A0M3IZC4_ANISI|nr:unnamed protein product [Anisakis simplex]